MDLHYLIMLFLDGNGKNLSGGATLLGSFPKKLLAVNNSMLQDPSMIAMVKQAAQDLEENILTEDCWNKFVYDIQNAIRLVGKARD